MLFDDSYRTIQAPAEGFFKDRGSKFYAFAFPIISEQDTKPLLATLREQHPKVVHHCYAYRLGLDRNQYRANDDGEPSGSAGRPILNILNSQDLTNILVVVVRYFGGSLLGIPGLINAYKTATGAALAQGVVIEKFVCDEYEVGFPYEATSEVNWVIKTYDLEITEQRFKMECTFRVLVRKSLLNRVVSAFDDIEKVQIKYLQTR